jgi:hypothetical protein
VTATVEPMSQLHAAVDAVRTAHDRLRLAEARVAEFRARNTFDHPLPKHERVHFLKAINAAVDARAAYADAQRDAKLARTEARWARVV